VACNNNDDDERRFVVPAQNGTGDMMGHDDVEEEPCASAYRNGSFSHRW
jgi:hypothetical protein